MAKYNIKDTELDEGAATSVVDHSTVRLECVWKMCSAFQLSFKNVKNLVRVF